MANLLFPVSAGGGAGTGTTYELKYDRQETSAAAYVTILDISGPGHIYHIQYNNTNAPGGTDHIKLTIDGYVNTRNITTTGNRGLALDILANSGYQITNPSASGGFGNYVTIHYKNFFKLEIRSDGVEPIITKVHYATG